ncbi:MAG: endonuclease III [candidate division WOR-3 bacterium]
MPDQDPWRVLIGAILSTRTRDEVTVEAVNRLLKSAPDPQALCRLDIFTIRRLIYPVGFYRTKARLLRKLAVVISTRHQGNVPRSHPELLALPGVGPKVANIVLARGFGIPAIAVDTHVHRIANRLGLVKAEKPAETERKLMAVVPEECLIDFNPLLVALGQTICLPRKPKCQRCPLDPLCPKTGLSRARMSR